MKTFKEAADQLGVSYSSIARRVSLLKMETGTDARKRLTVDADELERRWQARHERIAGPTGVSDAPLSVMIRQDQRFVIEQMQGKESIASVVRHLLDVGMAGDEVAMRIREEQGWDPVKGDQAQPVEG